MFHRVWDEKKSTNKFWEDLEQQTFTKEPTRILVVAPSQYVDPFLDTKHRGVLELAGLRISHSRSQIAFERLILLSFQVWTASQLS